MRRGRFSSRKTFANHGAVTSVRSPPHTTFATWTAGDPKVDIDGDARAATEGTPGYAGADVP